ncbi:type II toxin-antitoxin system Phd/YefM family antitoxin [Candidatus Chloroploca sp. M-50]|uniref:Antitoxin n=1 Tax=Candidatus Chloroploca mongolica TaxID=2528176 RepID=A0ABS4DE05_9CHLR|nr:type II toxin-antitoxin system Phd/YefM family antitoxin [Candidatus Chloroploca mongolica]MBP1467676.1 type II toxin-antitoxin system Phd/YefM family antitoxin [Candidatus Chloroploca mongolica]
MQIVTLEEAKRDLERLLTQVLDDAAPTIVLLASGQQVVMLPQEEYAAWQETRYLLASPANAAHLRTSIAEVTDGAIAERKLFEV